MFDKGERVRYSADYIREACDSGIEKIYAGSWRGKIIGEIGDGIYEVANYDFEEDVEEISEDILVLADD